MDSSITVAKGMVTVTINRVPDCTHLAVRIGGREEVFRMSHEEFRTLITVIAGLAGAVRGAQGVRFHHLDTER